MKRKDVDRLKISPMMLQYLEIKDNYEDVILFFRLGDFYEMFFEDATFISKELGLTLTGKTAGLEEKIPMCGIPYHALNNYMSKIIEKNIKIAICEQVTDPKESKGIVKREVVQVISNGTIINNDLLDETSNNYIGSIYDFEHCFSICYTDISTGEIYTKLCIRDTTSLINEILSLDLKEIVVNTKFDKYIVNILKNKYNLNLVYNNNYEENKEYEYIYEDISDTRYILVIKLLIGYLSNTKKKLLLHLKKVIVTKDDYLIMDIHTKRNLELIETLRLKKKEHSLLWLLDKTKTAMGSRLLKKWIMYPLINKEIINKRYDVISNLFNDFITKEELLLLLNEVYDIERLISKISFGSANARDLIMLKNSIKVLPSINECLEKINFHNKLDDVSDLYNLLETSIYEEPPVSIKEGYLIKDGYNKDIDELKSVRSSGKDYLINFEISEKERTGIKNLKVGYNKVFGYFIEVSKGSMNLVKDEFGYIRKQTLSTGERYITKELKEKEDMILGAEDKIINLEYSLFLEIRDKVKKYIVMLQNICGVVAEIDVLCSFTCVSEENKFIRPNIVDDRVVHIKNNRHPVVEAVIDNYIDNDIIMNENTNLLLITGPNMSGKSTYMRQFAITVIMAQIGCFVPASSCNIPIFDKIFTRIGASDDLVSGQSTFMVEMIEANNAIKGATKNSLVLFDELGRGTATYDGMSLSQAILEYICSNIECKTMFSTHYHELTSLEKNIHGLKNIHVSAHEEDGKITFMHKIKNGSIDKSYGLHVARIAGINENIIKRAKEVLNIYETKNIKKETFTQITLDIENMSKEKNIVEEKIKNINPLEITPIEALNILYELKKDIDKK